jgi:large subunit ribosomal protein L17
MRHRVNDKKFNRDANERKALFMGLLRALTEQGHIVTTQARGKVIKRLADRLITQAKVNTTASRRELHKTFGKRDVVNTLVDSIAPALSDRNSGYTRIIPMGSRRGDNTPMVRIEFVNQPVKVGTLKNEDKTEKAKAAPKKAVPAKKVEKTTKAAPAKADAAKAKKSVPAPVVKPAKTAGKTAEPQMKKMRKPTI